MRILIPTADYPPIEGGIATLALEVSRELVALGHEVTVVAPWFPDMEAFDAAEATRVLRFSGYHWGWLRLLPMAWRTWPALRNTDLVLAINVSHGGLIAWAAKFLRGTPYVTFAYAYEFLKFAALPPARHLLLSIYRNALVTVAISQFTRRRLEDFGVPPEMITGIFPGGMPRACALPETTLPPDSPLCRDLGDAPFILSVGRFIPRKGQMTLVRAMPEILEAHPDVHLVLAGRGPCLAECQSEIRALGLKSRVHCPGYVENETLAALYTACALFALPTGEEEGGHVEGFGLVFVEAQAHGKATVAGRSGGVEDAVLHGETGLLVKPDDPGETARAIVGLLSNPAEAKRLGNAGRQRVKDELNWRVFTQRLLEAAGVEKP